MPFINVKYFAQLKEEANKDNESLDFSGSYQELYQKLAQEHAFTLPSHLIQVAVNDEFTHPLRLVEEGAKVVFIPPVAGG